MTNPAGDRGWCRELSDSWERRWPASRPIGHDLRYTEADRWVRFHSLPGSKRYAENRLEYAEILRRHRLVLGELASDDRQPLRFSCAWSERRRPALRTRWAKAVLVRAKYWQSFLEDDSEPDFLIWTHLFVTRMSISGRRLRRLLRRVADDREAGVILADADLRWLYHPYDGGADVIATTPAQRDELRARHAVWLSTHPQGL